jgi:hypothetical protein
VAGRNRGKWGIHVLAAVSGYLLLERGIHEM